MDMTSVVLNTFHIWTVSYSLYAIFGNTMESANDQLDYILNTISYVELIY